MECVLIIPGLQRPRREDGEFHAHLAFIARPCLNTNKTNKKAKILKMPII
jgi:hypothetical protein